MRKQILIALLPLFTLIASAQQQYPSPTDNPLQQGQTVDCSDPTMASSPQCMGSQGLGSPGAGQFPSTLGMPSPQTQTVPTYTDQTQMQRQNQQQGTQMIPLMPEPLTEFQRFVSTTTGQVLPIFGASLFQNVPSTFAPVDNTPVPPDYVVGPDDELRIRVWGQVNFNANLRVDRSGDIYLPQVGQVHVAGLKFEDLSQHIQDSMARVYKNFQLQVEMGQIRSIQVYVTGQARRAGVYTVGSLASLIDALFASGGPSVQGSLRHIELRRNGQIITTLDLYDLLVNGDKSKDAKLLPGDVIYIPPVGGEVALFGSVRRPAIYELAPGETMEKLVHDAGGLSTTASSVRASVDRTVKQSEGAQSARAAMEIRLDASGMGTQLENGDIIHVLSLVPKFDNTVTLRGNTANPGRFAWHDGMKLSDLIPDRNALLTRNYWWKRAQLGLPAPEFEPAPALSGLWQPAAPIDLREREQLAQLKQSRREDEAARQTGTEPVNHVTSSEDAYLSYPSPQEQADAIQQTRLALGLTPIQNQNQTQNQNQSQNLPQTGTGAQQQIVPDINADGLPDAYNGLEPQQRTAASEGQESALGEEPEDNEPFTPTSTHRTVVKLRVPEIDWSYAVIERMDPTTLKTSLIPFDLGKLVNGHDPSQDLTLQRGDIVTVFSQSDIHVPLAEQTTFVRLEGEFVHAGTYSVQPGDTLRTLVERAGGLTPNAYLYGSVFTRESTRALQQRRIDETVHQMTLQMQRGILALTATGTSTDKDVSGVTAAQASQQALIAQLQQIRANGRIVFQFAPDSTGSAAIPDIKLENGDRFVVPFVPTTVNVVGAVMNQNSFLFRADQDVRSYMGLAGGPNTNADKKRMFIVRANGAVLSRTMVKSAWNDAFAHLRLSPGDTIIVPEKTIKPSTVRQVLDWTQIFSQLAFGAAAINVLR